MIDPHTTAEELERLAQSEDPNICRQIARHPNTSPELLKKLFRIYYEEVFANLALEQIVSENPDFLSELDSSSRYRHFELEPLSSFCYELAINSSEIWYAQAIALNPHTPIPILEQLIQDDRIEVHAAVGLNKNYPTEKLEKLVRSYSKSELADFIEATSDLNEYYFEGCNIDLFYYDIALSHIDSCEQPFTWFCGEIAQNHFTPANILAKLAHSRDIEVRADVASNSSTPLDILEELASDNNEEVLFSLACNENISSAILNQLASKINYDISHISKKDYYLILGLAGNPQTPQQTLRSWENHKSSEVRANIASNSNTPSDILESLSNDTNQTVLWNVGNNPNTPLKILEKLAENQDEYICRVASLNLRRQRN